MLSFSFQQPSLGACGSQTCVVVVRLFSVFVWISLTVSTKFSTVLLVCVQASQWTICRAMFFVFCRDICDRFCPTYCRPMRCPVKRDGHVGRRRRCSLHVRYTVGAACQSLSYQRCPGRAYTSSRIYLQIHIQSTLPLRYHYHPAFTIHSVVVTGHSPSPTSSVESQNH